jgi:hypothetical protein
MGLLGNVEGMVRGMHVVYWQEREWKENVR